LSLVLFKFDVEYLAKENIEGCLETSNLKYAEDLYCWQRKRRCYPV